MCHMAQLKKQIESRGKSVQACRHGDVKGQHGDGSQSKQPTSLSRVSCSRDVATPNF